MNPSPLTNDDVETPSTVLSRRDVLKSAAAAGVVLAVPALQGCAHAADKTWQAVGKTSDFVKGQPKRVALDSGPVIYVTRTSDTELTAVSASCTHRGCELAWIPDDKQLECPCHGAAFQSDGKNIHGTRRSPDNALPALTKVSARQTNDQVEINLADLQPPAPKG